MFISLQLQNNLKAQKNHSKWNMKMTYGGGVVVVYQWVGEPITKREYNVGGTHEHMEPMD